jgi:hypothetical protein
MEAAVLARADVALESGLVLGHFILTGGIGKLTPSVYRLRLASTLVYRLRLAWLSVYTLTTPGVYRLRLASCTIANLVYQARFCPKPTQNTSYLLLPIISIKAAVNFLIALHPIQCTIGT